MINYRMFQHRAIWLAVVALASSAADAAAMERIREENVPKADADFFKHNREPQVLHWVRPVFPPELRGETDSGKVVVGWTLAADGTMQDIEAVAGDERFYEAALAAVRQWRFQPAVENDKPVARSLRVSIGIRAKEPKAAKTDGPLPYPYVEVPLSAPQSRDCPDPVYPHHLVRRAVFGEVELVLGLDETGRVTGVEVSRTTHPDFLPPALAAVEKWQMEPARRGRRPVSGQKGAVLSFKVLDTETEHTAHEAWLEQNGIRLADREAVEPRLYFDRTPAAMSLVDPVYPAELREKGVEGEAVVDFSVDKSGVVVAATVSRASEEPFGHALLAAVAAWRFEPLYHGGEAAPVDFQVTWKFELPNERITSPGLLSALDPAVPRVGGRNLDGRIEPLLICPPVMPPGDNASGSADIELIINQEGRACWPKIVRADSPAVGWAAATAVSRWYFVTPRKDGQPVNVRVIVPVDVPRK